MIERNISISDNYQMNGVPLEKADPKTVRNSMQNNHPHDAMRSHGKLISPTAADHSESHIYHKTLGEEQTRRRPRYQRRNSAVASMLFPSISKQAQAQTAPTSTSRRPPLSLSQSLRHIDPLEALDHARKVLNCISDSSDHDSGVGHHDSRQSHQNSTDDLTGLTLGQRENSHKEEEDQRSRKRQRVEL